MPLVMWFLALALQVLGLEAASVVPQKTGGSTKLLDRLFETAKGKQLGVDVSLLETSFAKHKAPLTHQQAKELLNSMGKRVDPKGMRWHVENELLPMAESTSRALQGEIDEVQKALNNCSSLVWNAENAVTHRQHILDKDEEDEYKCIIEENAAVHEEKELCANVEHLISNTAKSEPAEMKKKSGTSASGVLAALKEAQDFYTKTFEDTSTANSKCDEARAKADKLHASCLVAEEVVEKFYCYMKAGRDAACADYDKCYQEKLQNFKDVKSRVEKTDTLNKEHFTQMACSYWVKDIAGTSCESTIADTGHLDITYPEEPIKATCSPVQKFHARREHAHFECKDGNPVKMLDNMFPASAPETPAPETPASEELEEADAEEEPLEVGEADGSEATDVFTELTTDGRRCGGAPTSAWGSFGTDMTVDQCKQACQDLDSCSFVVHKRENGACTEYTECSTFKKDQGGYFTSWQKAVGVETDKPALLANVENMAAAGAETNTIDTNTSNATNETPSAVIASI